METSTSCKHSSEITEDNKHGLLARLVVGAVTESANFLTERAIRWPDYRTLHFTTGLLLASFLCHDLETPKKYIYYGHIIFEIWNLLNAQNIPGVPAPSQAFLVEPDPL